jgi:hypothetical protein
MAERNLPAKKKIDVKKVQVKDLETRRQTTLRGGNLQQIQQTLNRADPSR